MEIQIAVASHSLSAGFTGAMYTLLGKYLRPGYSIVECGIVLRDDAAHMRSRLVKLLQGDRRPAALIGICIRPDPRTIADFRASGTPVVLIDEREEGVSTVASDNHAGGYLAGKALAGAGRRSIAVVTGRRHVNGGYNAAQRWSGFTKALGEHGIAVAADDVVEVIEYSRKEGEAALASLVRPHRRPDAIFCSAGDYCAGGVLAAARERQIKVPEDIAVIGYDDGPLAKISHPPLTTIRQPMEKIAAEALRLATERREQILAKPAISLFPPELVRRESL